MFLVFVPIKPFIDKAVNVGADFVPIVSPAYKYTKKASEISKLTNPVAALSRATGYVVITCTGPVISRPIICGLWASSTVAGWVSGNPGLIAFSFEMANIMLEDWTG
jgi:hypothetical protein